jgi:hypothetical protein
MVLIEAMRRRPTDSGRAGPRRIHGRRDDLTELVERAAAAEKTALASKWKEQADVHALIRNVRKNAEQQRQDATLDTPSDQLSPRWAGLRQTYLDLGPQPALPGQEPSTQLHPDEPDDAPRRLSHQAAAQAELDAVAAVGVARMALTDGASAVLQVRLARIQAGEDVADAALVDGHVPLRRPWSATRGSSSSPWPPSPQRLDRRSGLWPGGRGQRILTTAAGTDVPPPS